jgi:hypothetical protein
MRWTQAFVAGEPADIQAHELEVADLSISPLKPRPELFPIGSIHSSAPFGSVVARDRGRKTLRDHRAPHTHVG